MTATTRLLLPVIAPQQAQKQVSYNAAVALLDQLVQPAVLSRTTSAPPASPAVGDCYIVAPAATGAWAGKDNRFACYGGGVWSFAIPGTGWQAYVIDTAEQAVFAGGTWHALIPSGAALASFGIHMAADLVNRLAVAADASLFTHDGTSHRLKINKAASADTASLLLQTGLSGRAEIGLAGDDQLHLKVSPNGSSWIDALTIAQATGAVSLPAGQLAFPATANPSSNANTLDDYREGSWTPVVQFGGASTGITYGAATSGRYTRIGRTVIAHGIVTLTNKGTATGTAGIGGLPLGALVDPTPASAAIGYAAGLSSVTGALLGSVASGASRVTLYQLVSGTAASLTNSNFSNTSTLQLSVMYDT